jgi:hypothetical protein
MIIPPHTVSSREKRPSSPDGKIRTCLFSDEGIELRRGGVKAPILVMTGISAAEEVSRILTYNLTPVVFEKASLEIEFISFRKYDLKNIPIKYVVFSFPDRFLEIFLTDI